MENASQKCEAFFVYYADADMTIAMFLHSTNLPQN